MSGSGLLPCKPTPEPRAMRRHVASAVLWDQKVRGHSAPHTGFVRRHAT